MRELCRRRRSWTVVVALLALLALPAVSAARSGWWREAALYVTVHEHAFDRVTANNHQCVVRVRLHFDAPQTGYGDADASRNEHAFIAEVKLSGGHRFVSERFVNREAGRRVFAFSYDSQFDGCWADADRKLRKVNVHACRGQNCRVRPFD